MWLLGTVIVVVRVVVVVVIHGCCLGERAGWLWDNADCWPVGGAPEWAGVGCDVLHKLCTHTIEREEAEESACKCMMQLYLKHNVSRNQLDVNN